MTNKDLPEVVRATVRGVPDVAAVRIGPGDYQWFALGAPDSYGVFQAKDVTDRRPLVLIDPEAAEKLLGRLHGLGYMIHPDALSAALRSLAEVEPTLPEPQGLGAVVRDANGHAWERLRFDGMWHQTDGRIADWPNLPEPVTVLAEGWSE